MVACLLRPWLARRLEPLCSPARRAAPWLPLQPPWHPLSWWNFVATVVSVEVPLPLRPLHSGGERNARKRLRRRRWQLLLDLNLLWMRRAMAECPGALLLAGLLLRRPLLALRLSLHPCSCPLPRPRRLRHVNTVARSSLRGTSSSSTSSSLAIVNSLHHDRLATLHLCLGSQLALMPSLQPAVHINVQQLSLQLRSRGRSCSRVVLRTRLLRAQGLALIQASPPRLPCLRGPKALALTS
jgi:hypothetical protein